MLVLTRIIWTCSFVFIFYLENKIMLCMLLIIANFLALLELFINLQKLKKKKLIFDSIYHKFIKIFI